jgi:hypothetical protein
MVERAVTALIRAQAMGAVRGAWRTLHDRSTNP